MDVELDAAAVAEVTALVRRAGDRSLEWFRRPMPVDLKPGDRGWDPVTDADRAVEADLRAGLTERFPGTSIVGEEAGVSGGGDLVWVIDPIDGTRSFVTGNPLYGTLLGLHDGTRARAGWMHLPALGETYVAVDGTPAEMIDRDGVRHPLRTRRTVALRDAIVACTHPAMFSDAAERRAFDAVVAGATAVRYGGDCVNYALLALGFLDAVIETTLAPHDIIGLLAILGGAGATVTTPDGSVPLAGGFVVASATAELHDEILFLVRTQLAA